MGSLIQVWAKRLQRTAGWSSSRQSWKERGSALVLIVGAGGLGWYGRGFSTAAQAGLWALLVGLWALLARAGWLHLFGPLLLYDLVRTIRRSRIVLVRITYTLFLFMLLLFVYLIVFYDSRDDFRALFTGVSVAPASLANFASGF